MESQYFSYRAARFHYRDTGKGKAVILLHGFLENQGMWEPLTAELQSNYRCIAPDLPGHGDSENLGYIHTMEEMADMVYALLQKLRLRKVVLCGHSMGGYVSLAFAEKYPDHVKGLVLLNSTARADSLQKKEDRRRAIDLVKQNAGSFIRNSIPHLFRPKSRNLYRREIAALKQDALKMSPQGIVAALEGMRIRPDREVLLHLAPYHVLFLAARRDPVLPLHDLEEQARAGRVISHFTENGHMSHMEDREAVHTYIHHFLKEYCR